MNGEVATNKTTITVITTTVAVMAFLCVLSVCVLSYYSIEISKDLGLITTGLVGALTGMLVKTSPTESTRQTAPLPVPSGGSPTPVQVVNEPTDPVPTTEETK